MFIITIIIIIIIISMKYVYHHRSSLLVPELSRLVVWVANCTAPSMQAHERGEAHASDDNVTFLHRVFLWRNAVKWQLMEWVETQRGIGANLLFKSELAKQQDIWLIASAYI